MNAPTPVAAKVTSPAELVTALPYLLGFHPRDSLVVVTLEPGAPPTVGLVMRADLPANGDEHELVEQLCAPLRPRAPGTAVIIVIGGPACAPAAVAMLRAAFDEFGVAVAHVLWAESTHGGARWRRLDEPGGAGVLPDSTAGPLAAASAAAGIVTFSDRAHLAALLAPDDDAELERRARLLDAAVEEAEHDRSTRGPVAAAGDLELVRAAVAAAADGRLPTGDDEIVRLAVALSDTVVRDLSLGLCLGETAAGAELLWQTLTRLTPAPEVAEPAALTAFAAYLRGDGALARIALDRALQAWPGHNLSTLLQFVLYNGIAPERLERFVTDAVDDAATELADADGHQEADR